MLRIVGFEQKKQHFWCKIHQKHCRRKLISAARRKAVSVLNQKNAEFKRGGRKSSGRMHSGRNSAGISPGE